MYHILNIKEFLKNPHPFISSSTVCFSYTSVTSSAKILFKSSHETSNLMVHICHHYNSTCHEDPYQHMVLPNLYIHLDHHPYGFFHFGCWWNIQNLDTLNFKEHLKIFWNIFYIIFYFMNGLQQLLGRSYTWNQAVCNGKLRTQC